MVLGTVRTHIVRATNTGYFPVSFSADRQALTASGFHVELDRVKQLPGFPDHETVDFRVSFDPRGANVGLGEVVARVPINVSISHGADENKIRPILLVNGARACFGGIHQAIHSYL